MTVDNTTRTVSAVTTNTEVTLAAGDLVPGRSYWWVSSQSGAHAALVRCAQSDGGVVRLEAPPAGSAIEVGDTFVGARLFAVIPLEATGERALHYHAEWSVTEANGRVSIYQQAVHICRTLFRPAVLPDEAARYLSLNFPAMGYDRPWGYYAELARRASLRVEKQMLAAERHQHLVGDYDVFTGAGVVALRFELANEGLIAPGTEPMTLEEQDKAIGAAVQLDLAGCWYDDNDNGEVDEGEVTGFMSFDLERS